MQVTPIGVVHSCYKDRFGIPRQPGLVPEALAEIEIFPQFQPELSLLGLQQFSHLWVIFQFHRSMSEKFHAKVHPPRLNGKSVGVFASRSPHRPNSLGLSVVKIAEIKSASVVVSGGDFLDQTPVFDLKPYLPDNDKIENATMDWAPELSPSVVQFVWPELTLLKLAAWQSQEAHSELKSLIESTLKLDPRPKVYKGYEGSAENKYRSMHAMRVLSGDIHFRYLDSQTIEIIDILYDLKNSHSLSE